MGQQTIREFSMLSGASSNREIQMFASSFALFHMSICRVSGAGPLDFQVCTEFYWIDDSKRALVFVRLTMREMVFMQFTIFKIQYIDLFVARRSCFGL